MEIKDMKKGICTLKLNSISNVAEDPLLLKATYSILDFSVSGNRDIVSKDLALESALSLKGKPLLCIYTPSTTDDTEQMNDHFNSHGDGTLIDRNGDEYIGSDSIAIGTALEGGYLGVIKDKDGNETEALLCDFYCWRDRNILVLQLLEEMYNNNMPIYSSCEYYYSNFSVSEGITTMMSPLYFSGHCILSSGENGYEAIAPSYDSSKLLSFNSKLNSAIEKAIIEKSTNDIHNQPLKVDDIDINKTVNEKEDKTMKENLFFKILCELSHGDIKEQIMTSLSKTMTVDEFYNIYLSNYGIYDAYFVCEDYQNSKYVNYKIPYTKTDTEVVVDLANKVEVERDVVWVEVTTMEASINSLKTEMETSVNGLNEQIKTLNETIATKDTDILAKDEAIVSLNAKVEKIDEITNTVTSLNAKVLELQPKVDKYNDEQYEKSLNATKEYYKEKFEKVEALEVFEKEETQELIKKSINSIVEEAKDAKLSLTELIVNNIKSINKKVDENSEEFKIKLNSVQGLKDNKDLIGNEDAFEALYGFKK